MFRTWPRWTAAVVCLVLLAGCKTELYSGISQRDANEMMAVLLRGGVDAEKIPGKENTVTLMVEETQQERAIDLLMANGLPRVKTANIGEVFNKEGLISSPTEEKARFVYAMSEEISRTLAELDGVISVRVHVVLPETGSQSRGVPLKPASAAIFMKHQEKYDFTSMIPQVKQLVANSIGGLSYDKVSVVLFPSTAVDLPPVNPKAKAGLLKDFIGNEKAVLSALGLLAAMVLALTGAVIYLALSARKARPSAASGAE